MHYNQFDIVLIEFPFTDKKHRFKVRPVVIISSAEYNKNSLFVIAAMITSAKNSTMWGDILIEMPELSDLRPNSCIRIKLGTVMKEDVIKKISSLDFATQLKLKSQLNQLLNL